MPEDYPSFRRRSRWEVANSGTEPLHKTARDVTVGIVATVVAFGALTRLGSTRVTLVELVLVGLSGVLGNVLVPCAIYLKRLHDAPLVAANEEAQAHHRSGTAATERANREEKARQLAETLLVQEMLRRPQVEVAIHNRGDWRQVHVKNVGAKAVFHANVRVIGSTEGILTDSYQVWWERGRGIQSEITPSGEDRFHIGQAAPHLYGVYVEVALVAVVPGEDAEGPYRKWQYVPGNSIVVPIVDLEITISADPPFPGDYVRIYARVGPDGARLIDESDLPGLQAESDAIHERHLARRRAGESGSVG
jgi:hypothetical protein